MKYSELKKDIGKSLTYSFRGSGSILKSFGREMGKTIGTGGRKLDKINKRTRRKYRTITVRVRR